MADLTQSLFDVEEQLNGRGALGRMVKVSHDGRHADPEVVARLQGGDPLSEWNQGLRRRFLRRMTLALISYGSSAPRTEFLIKSASKRLAVKTKIAVLNSLVILLFNDTTDASREEIHLMKEGGAIDVNKLQKVDELANAVGLNGMPVMLAQWRLRSIIHTPSRFEEWYFQIPAFVIASGTGALLFFKGNYWDAILSLSLGLLVGIMHISIPLFPVFGIVMEFVCALVVSFLARIYAHYFYHLDVCYFSMAISGLVWMLPGQGLTIGVSEVVEGAVVTGSARVVKAIITSLQLGFGLVIGQKLVWWLPKFEPIPCVAPTISAWFLAIGVVAYVFSMNIKLHSRLGQWIGMTAVASVGYLVYKLSVDEFGTETATVISSFVIGLAATICSYVVRDIPLSMILAGIQVLLPGGIGVQGVTVFMKEDAMSGISFMMNMVIICLSITIGLLLSKVFLHDGIFGATKVIKRHHRSKRLLSKSDGERQRGLVVGNVLEEDEHVAI